MSALILIGNSITFYFIYDATFMVIDLFFINRWDLSFSFFNTCVENSGEYKGAAILAFYAGPIASVRGTVNFFLND